ncbi:hypothetical protein [Haliscomenobacter sp.]|uniref:hypothetical protein n=1 Tax=Haliscomenobacter sp. TaxID=2717303 RepID=UPI00359416E3
MITTSYRFAGKALFYLLLAHAPLLAQTDVQAWGNLTGTRANGQLFRFESSIRLIQNNWQRENATGRERNWTTYRREGNAQVVRTRMDSLFFTQTVQDGSPGNIQVNLDLDPHRDQEFTGVFFHLNLPAKTYAAAEIQQIDPGVYQVQTEELIPVGENERLRVLAKGLAFKTGQQSLRITSNQADLIIVKSNPKTGDLGIYFTLQAMKVKAGQKTSRQFNIQVEGKATDQVAQVELFPQYPGRQFLGLGGNFRLQNFQQDPQVIDYCLKNMEVRMARVELPWRLWHPYDSINPLEAARKGEIHPRVKAALELAQRLHKMKMPVLLAAWFPPQWAAIGPLSGNDRNADGSFGNPLRSERTEAIYASITSYILYLKEAYGVEVSMFSFNESDLGINVRHSAAEHAVFIKGLGAYMKARGLKTKLLLGDTADANGFAFVNAALDDPQTWEYIGAVSFHSWRGWEKSTLLEWHDAANRLKVPLIVGEGSIDAGAWRYPKIFEEGHYALEEIKLYVRMLNICQPQTIMQWQLTSDYSPLVGGGLFGNNSIPLRPTQRFWNLKQLAATPMGLNIIPLTSNVEDIHLTALSDAAQKKLSIHLVNEGAERTVELKGLPAGIKTLQVYLTDQKRGMQKGPLLEVKQGTLTFQADAACFISLMSE